MAAPDHPSAIKQAVAGLFSATAASHDSVGTPLFGHFGSLLVDRAGPEVGDRVLDVAAGTGATLFPAAGRVGAQGRVVAVDLAPGMVDVLSAAIAVRGLTNAEALVADAEDLPFADASFDVVLCGFALFFFPDTARALSEFRRVLRHGGGLAISTFTRAGSRSIAGIWERMAPFVAPPTAPDDHVEFNEPPQLQAALDAAGFTDVVVEESPFEVVLADFDAWWAWIRTMEFREYLEQMDAATLERFRDSAHADLAARPGAPEIRLRMDALLTRARKP